MRTLLGMQYGGTVPRKNQMVQAGGRLGGAGGVGGGVSSGLAYLMRGKKRQEAYDVAEKERADEIERRKRSGTWGSALGIGGGLLGSAALGALGLGTGGLGLALAAGAGTGLGKLLGSRAGYEGGWSPGMMFRRAGKPKFEEDVMYGKEAGLEDIARGSKEYISGMDQAAGLDALKAGLTAGFAPGGGMYGKAAGLGDRMRLGRAAALAASGTQASATALAPYGESLGLDVIPQQQIPGAPGSLTSGSLAGYGDPSYAGEGLITKQGVRTGMRGLTPSPSQRVLPSPYDLPVPSPTTYTEAPTLGSFIPSFSRSRSPLEPSELTEQLPEMIGELRNIFLDRTIPERVRSIGRMRGEVSPKTSKDYQKWFETQYGKESDIYSATGIPQNLYEFLTSRGTW